MRLTEIVKKRYELQNELKSLEKSFFSKKDELDKEISKCIQIEKIFSEDLDYNQVVLAKTVMYTRGNITIENDDRVNLAELAVKDIANRTSKMRTEYFGIKSYSGFVQLDNHRYGLGPKHGSTIAAVGLCPDARERDLTVEESDACIYFLNNFDIIYPIIK